LKGEENEGENNGCLDHIAKGSFQLLRAFFFLLDPLPFPSLNLFRPLRPGQTAQLNPASHGPFPLYRNRHVGHSCPFSNARCQVDYEPIASAHKMARLSPEQEVGASCVIGPQNTDCSCLKLKKSITFFCYVHQVLR
jgi:hypothetical protein